MFYPGFFGYVSFPKSFFNSLSLSRFCFILNRLFYVFFCVVETAVTREL